jgi:hypothetical protein
MLKLASLPLGLAGIVMLTAAAQAGDRYERDY